MMSSIVLAIVLVLSTFFFHYRILLGLSSVAAKIEARRDAYVLIVVLVLFVAHLVEICAYAAAYGLAAERLELGHFVGAMDHSAMAYIYYSGVTYTSLGVGDIRVEGHLRFLTSMEVLNGLLLIAWSASYTYLTMIRTWRLGANQQPINEPTEGLVK